MNTKQAVLCVALVFLACACSVTWALCTQEVRPLAEECKQVVNDVTKNGTVPTQSCSGARRIVDCYKRLEAMCEDMTMGDSLYIRMQAKNAQCSKLDGTTVSVFSVSVSPRPSVGFVLIAVSVISVLLAANRY